VDAYRQVIDAGVDLVILAAPPHVRPLHLEAAVSAGKHVYCEKPAAVDVGGAVRAAAAAARARAAGLSLASGLCFRHDPRTAAVVARVHDGAIGRPMTVQVHAAIGLPWRKPVDAAGRGADWRLRNWISFAGFSGGHLVEHHVEAIDRGLWLLGDAVPAVAQGGLDVRYPGRSAIGDCPARTNVRYGFADGRSLEASVERCERDRWRIEETANGTRGSCDLVAGTIAGRPLPLPAAGPERYAAVMNRLVAGVLSGRPVHEGEALCKSTLVAVMGRIAAESGRPVTWAEVAGAASASV
jgi:predicted dehydrogenase